MQVEEGSLSDEPHITHDESATRSFTQAVLEELQELQQRRLEWLAAECDPHPDEPLDALDRRERERLERLERQAHTVWRERTRERVARERERPWREQDRWGLRKRVWKERRDAERVLLDRREEAMLAFEQQLEQHHTRWLAELLRLAPETSMWCGEQTQQRERGTLTASDLEQLWQRRRYAAEQRAEELLQDPKIRAVVHAATPGDAHEPLAVAQAITPALLRLACGDDAMLPKIAVLFAAIAQAAMSS